MKKIHAILFLSLILLTSACLTSGKMSGKMLMNIRTEPLSGGGYFSYS